jgi:hypothetical protein
MSMIDSLRKGLRFFLMSFGVSSQAKKPVPSAVSKTPAEPRK